MIRFAWLQFRTQAVVAIGALAVVAIGLGITGPHIVHLYNTNVATCAARGNCSTAKTLFLRNDRTLRTWLGILVIVIPGLIGLFWGAPLIARELETGTYRIAWTQDVSRTRWLAVKLLLVGLSAMAVALVVSLMVTWWASPFDIVDANRFAPSMFDERGIVAVGYGAFAFVVGVTAGVLTRRTVPAMATTLVAFVAARLTFAAEIAPHLIAPTHQTLALNPTSMGFGQTGNSPFQLFPPPSNMPNTWTYSTRIADHAGHSLTSQHLASACPQLIALASGPPPPSPQSNRPTHIRAPEALTRAMNDCVTKIGATYHEIVTYQPANRYWTFQWYETAIFAVAALALTAFCFWWVRRRLA